MASGSPAELMKEIRTLVPMYEHLRTGEAWEPEKSPLRNSVVDLSLGHEDGIQEIRTEKPSVFSSGMMTTRSKELKTVVQRE
jgi:hypothetical protein